MSRPSTAIARTVPATPLPTALQLTPSHLARNELVTPPAEVKLPPAYTLPASVIPRAKTTVRQEDPVQPLMPLPRANQLVPFQRTILLATPVGVGKAKEPPT